MESKDCSSCVYFSSDFSPGMPGRRIESFGLLPAIQRSPPLFEIPQIGDSVVKINFAARRVHSLLSSKTFTDSEEGVNMVMALSAND